ncbi:phosphoribosylglycinamide formyltransferase [Hoeflea poritis]|uniref:Phosphoribosylglycinamide formyltransferase n=1 Tax=Hoeflea poritis TaxID=2993659 RepID=A0ABT4VQK2_9HYPH|nr:phosphoribosylglycinamide formyltransferase [Hoeflea poritis]MDA4846992.1 phosphoribosylglycinamide formyltransferase [Hoeflea poritis]
MSAADTGHKRVAVMISGRGSNLGALISASMASDYPCRIVGVVSDRLDAAGLQLAADYDIETHVVERKDHADRAAHEDAIQAVLETMRPDMVCLAGYMRLLSGDFVSRWMGSMINIHPSLLPSFTGLDTHQRVLSHQVRLHGCSVHFVTEGMDEGPLIAQAAVPVLPDDDADSLAARVLKAEHKLYPSALRLVAEGKVRITDSGTVLFRDYPEADGDAVLYSHTIGDE